MTPAPFRWAMRHQPSGIRHLTPVRSRAATGVVARVYAAAEREFGLLAPPVALHSPRPDLLAASWVLLRETLLVTGGTSRAVRETVAAAVSLANSCPYCVEVHGAVLGGLGRGARADAGALAADRIDDVADPGLRAVARWARDGGPGRAPVPADQVPEVLGVVLAFHYLNRMVQVFLGPSPLPPALPAAAAATAGALLGRVLGPTALRVVRPGADLDLLSPADLPADLEWAAPNPALAVAVARSVAAADEAGRQVLTPAVRSAVHTSVIVHGGRPPVLGLDWVTPVLEMLPRPQHAAARLALFTALAPQRVDDAVVAAFRADRPETDLLAVACWASLTAARRATAVVARTAGDVSHESPAVH